MVYRNDETGKYDIYDWKRVKNINIYNTEDRSTVEQISHVDNTNFNYYSL